MPHDEPVDPRSTTSTLTAFVIIGGDPLPAAVVTAVAQRTACGRTLLIAADSGLDHALAAGLRPQVVVGDFDSVSPDALGWARSNDVVIHEHPVAKDDTDTELALATAREAGATDIVLVSGGGDRLDHSIGALSALGHTSLGGPAAVSALWSDSTVHVLHGPRALTVALPPGTTFSLLALHGRCTGVSEVGAAWPLDGAVIEPGSSLGISNVSIEPVITISVDAGVLTVVIPAHTALLSTPAGLS